VIVRRTAFWINRHWINRFAIGLMMSLGLMNVACSEFKLGGKNANDLFVEPQLAALARAAEQGREAEIERLVKSGVPIDGLGNWGRLNPLAWALTAGSYAGARKLLELGANPNHEVQYFRQLTPLILLYAESRQSEFLELLLQFKANPNAVYPDGGDSALMKAVMNKRNVELLVQYGADVNWYQERYEASAATRAADLAQWDVLDFLLAKGTTVTLENIARVFFRSNYNEESQPRIAKVLKLLKERGVDMEQAKLPLQPKPRPVQNPAQ
jgi:ankyrin repeat protein